MPLKGAKTSFLLFQGQMILPVTCSQNIMWENNTGTMDIQFNNVMVSFLPATCCLGFFFYPWPFLSGRSELRTAPYSTGE